MRRVALNSTFGLLAGTSDEEGSFEGLLRGERKLGSVDNRHPGGRGRQLDGALG